MTPSLKTMVAGIQFENCIYNASGPRTGSSAALARITASAAGGVLAKSATLESQTGNPQPRFVDITVTLTVATFSIIAIIAIAV
jgi:dihydroorotate dehydrogenase (fumarate)